VIPEVAVTIKSAETGTARKSLTDAQGEYSFLQVPPGAYKLFAEKPGFATMTKGDVMLLVNTPETLDLKMSLSANGEIINVASEASQVNTTDASVGNPFGERQVRQLPLQTRNVVELLSLQPGVTTDGEVLGARRDQNNITLDGADVNNNQNSGLVAQSTGTGTGGYQGSNANGSTINSGFNAVLPVPLDSVQEFRVTVAGQGPNVGRSSGGQVNLVTKSGTNQLHGSLYEYNRNTWFAANTWFNNHAGVPRQPLVRNQFGASIGGKIIPDRVFYFFNYEQREDASGVAQVRAVPSDTLRKGIFLFKSGGVTQTLSATDIANLAISPDEKSIATDKTDTANENTDVFIYDRVRASFRRLTFDSGIDAVPVWSPDCRRIAFTSSRGHNFGIYVKPVDGSESERQLGLTDGVDALPADWSRDGNILLYLAPPDLWVYSFADAKAREFLKATAFLKNAQFSPDGKWVAYSSNESGRWEVYVTSFPDARGKWQVSTNGGEQPRWRGDGKEIYYLSSDAKLMAVSVDTRTEFESGTPATLFQTNPREQVATTQHVVYDVSRDGQRFLVNTKYDNGSAHPMSVILNWQTGKKK
jgi:hypothetical protein